MINTKCKCCLDHKSIMDEKMLNAMLSVEEKYTLTSSYFTRFQSQIKPSMRTTLATWMLEVCEEQECTDEVYSLAMNIFDRLMCVIDKCEKQYLQLLGTACLFIAAKVKTNVTNKLSAYKLVEYTDFSVSVQELLDWELLILQKLKWDVASITANDFVEPFLHRLDGYDGADERMQVLRKHAYILTALCSTDFKFSLYPASMIASACILAALDGINSSSSTSEKQPKQTLIDADYVCNRLATKASMEQECLLSLKELVEELFKQHSPCQEMKEEDEEVEDESVQLVTIVSNSNDDDSGEFVDENFDFDCCDYYDYDSLQMDEIDYEIRNFGSIVDPTAASNSTDSFDIIEPTLFKNITNHNANNANLAVHQDSETNYERELNLKFLNAADTKLSRSSSSSSGVSSSSGLQINTNILNINNAFRVSPPLPNTLPMPKFSKKSSPTKTSTSSAKHLNNNNNNPKNSKKSSKDQSKEAKRDSNTAANLLNYTPTSSPSNSNDSTCLNKHLNKLVVV